MLKTTHAKEDAHAAKKQYLQKNRWTEFQAIAWAPLLLTLMGPEAKPPQPNNLPQLGGRSKVRNELDIIQSSASSLLCDSSNKLQQQMAGNPRGQMAG